MNTSVELRNITNDSGKSSTAQRSACMTKFNAYLRHDQVHLTLPSDINWSTLRIVDLQDANANFLPDVFGRFGHYLFEHGNIKWKSADQYLSALKKQILTSYPTTLPIFVVFYSTLRLKLKRLYDQRVDEDEVDLIHHHEPLTKKVLKRLNTTTKSTLIKLRRLVNSIHYLAKDDAHVLAWCKTIPTQRSPDWAARITLKSIELQDIVINKLKEIGCKQNNKAPYFWSTYKTFEVNKLFVQSDNYFN